VISQDHPVMRTSVARSVCHSFCCHDHHPDAGPADPGRDGKRDRRGRRKVVLRPFRYACHASHRPRGIGREACCSAIPPAMLLAMTVTPKALAGTISGRASGDNRKFRVDLDSTCPLIGQPTLRRRIKLGILAALDQRIAVRYTMPGMTTEETASYISHHLTLAGRSDPLFSDDAITLIHQTSRGLPRAVNNLAIQALIAAYASRKAIVDESSARTAATEVTSD
jgi:hypothetical protein